MSREIKLLHTNSSITLKALGRLLDESNIPFMIKDNVESARLAGFGTQNNANELYVLEEDFNRAEEILDAFLAEG